MPENTRPDIKVPYTKKYLLIDIFTLLGIVLSAAAVYIASRTLPDIFPTHFGLTGKPDGYGNPERFLRDMLVFTGAQLFVWVLCSIPRFIPRHCNYPVKITEGNAAVQYKLAVDLCYNLKIWVVATFMILEICIIWSAFSGELNILLVAVFIPLVIMAYLTIDFAKKSLKNK